MQGKTGLGGESFIKPWMIDLADDHQEIDVSRAREQLGWEPRHSLRATLPRMLAALQADPIGWFPRSRAGARRCRSRPFDFQARTMIRVPSAHP